MRRLIGRMLLWFLRSVPHRTVHDGPVCAWPLEATGRGAALALTPAIWGALGVVFGAIQDGRMPEHWVWLLEESLRAAKLQAAKFQAAKFQAAETGCHDER